MVQKMLLTCCFTGGYLRSFRFVVCAASALAALGVPPFRIWHDLSRFYRGGLFWNTTTIDIELVVFI
jgi:hypothetical protein